MTVEQELRKLRRDVREYATRLIQCERAIDLTMARLDSHERGKQIAAIANEIQLITDGMLHFGLGWTFVKMRHFRKSREMAKVEPG